MTAVVGILNKQGVAIAADSAVTVSGLQSRKIYNSANKIFTLSKYHPVGIAIYNSAQFMGIPWEIIIKEYRKQLSDKKFPALLDYKNDFLRWFKENNYFQDDKNDNFLFQDFFYFVQTLINKNKNLFEQNKEDIENALETILSDYISNDIPNTKKIESLKLLNKDGTLAFLRAFADQIINMLKHNFKTEFKKEDIGKLLIESYFAYLTHNQFLQYTGLIFTGFGEKELFPRLLSVDVSIVIDGKLRYKEDDDKNAIISNKHKAYIRPFAQTDVIDTILQGISPELNYLSANVFGNFIERFIKEIQSINGISEEVQNQLDKLKIDEYMKRYQVQINNIVKERYVNPLMGAVAQLSKEDLAEMAESLVYLTYLKRRFTMAEESVGGPVDISIITKGDGFIWIKRKHYFDPELNQNFFKKYFRV